MSRKPQQLPFDLLDEGLKAAARSCDERPELEGRSYLNEAWVQSFVAFGLNDFLRQRYETDNEYITFETNVAWLDAIYGVEGVDTSVKQLTPKKRFDLCVWSKGMKIWGLVEIKNQPSAHHWSYKGDLLKLSWALHRWQGLRWGLFLYGMPPGRLERANEIRQACKDLLRDFRVTSFAPRQADHSTWVGFLVRRQID